MENDLPSAVFFQGTFPSANQVLLTGISPILVDSGFGSDFARNVARLRRAGVDPTILQCIVNTHYHCDHCGGNFRFQQDYRSKIAAYFLDAHMINQRDPESCSANWLGQRIEPYHVDIALKDGDVLNTGSNQWLVIHTPGHTLGHIALYSDGILIAGDTFHTDDVAWLNIFREGAPAIYSMINTLEQLQRLPLRTAYSGHGPANNQPVPTLEDALRRYERWIKQPERVGWHACKRIFTYALMLTNGMEQSEISAYLVNCDWFQDYSRHIFHTAPMDFVQPLVDELIRAQAAYWENGRLIPYAPYNPPPPAWLASIPKPQDWPAML
jgi:hydroxyacylglutathione hydrolase